MGIPKETKAIESLANGAPTYAGTISCVSFSGLLAPGQKFAVCELGAAPIGDIQCLRVFGSAGPTDSGLWGFILTNRDPTTLDYNDLIASLYPESTAVLYPTGAAGIVWQVQDRIGVPKTPFRYLVFVSSNDAKDIDAMVVVERRDQPGNVITVSVLPA